MWFKKVPKFHLKLVKKTVEPVPSTSGTSMRKGGPIDMSSEDSYEGDSDIFHEDDELCCVCNKWEPKELQKCAAFVIAKWAKCDYCPHWTHLNYCSKGKFVRFKEEFRCPHCHTKIVSEYDQEIPQSQTADNPVAPGGRAAQPSQDTRKTN